MLELNDSHWDVLKDAHGAAVKIPALIQQLYDDSSPKNSYKEEPWFTLWSSLCHQGTIYTASYATVPHLIEIALQKEKNIDFNFFLLPVSIEIARRTHNGPDLPEELKDDYLRAIQKLPQCVKNQINNEWDEPTTKAVIAALALAKGGSKLAEKILEETE
jgi:hypothetical protein